MTDIMVSVDHLTPCYYSTYAVKTLSGDRQA